MNEQSDDALEFTGERFTPECVREIWYEHWHRYVFARGFAHGRRVVDAACGEGYGSALLAQTADDVIGVDISAQTVEHARARYAAIPNLRFEQRDCTQLALPAASVDLAVCFETLEHVEAQESLVTGFARILAESGVLILSSPDKHAYTDVSGFRNEFHVRELYRDELLGLLAPHFPHVRLYGQKLLFQSAIWALDSEGGHVDAATADAGRNRFESGLQYAPLYFVAVCSRQPLVGWPELALFGDRDESVYSHYNGEVRKNMAAGDRIVELETEVATLHTELEHLRNHAGLR